MSHNLNPSDSPEFALPELAVISIEGADASRFLHAQTMNDVAGLAAMDWHLERLADPARAIDCAVRVGQVVRHTICAGDPRNRCLRIARGFETICFPQQSELHADDRRGGCRIPCRLAARHARASFRHGYAIAMARRGPQLACGFSGCERRDRSGPRTHLGLAGSPCRHSVDQRRRQPAMDATTTLARTLARLQREKRLLSGTGNCGAHTLSGQRQKAAALGAFLRRRRAIGRCGDGSPHRP